MLTFEKFMNKYDKGKDLKEIINNYYYSKNQLIEAFNKNLYYKSFHQFEKLLKEQTLEYKRLGEIDDDLLPLPKSLKPELRLFQSNSLKKDIFMTLNSKKTGLISELTGKKLRRIGTTENMVKKKFNLFFRKIIKEKTELKRGLDRGKRTCSKELALNQKAVGIIC